MYYYGAAYYPEHRDPSKWDYDLDLMQKAFVNAVRVGEFAWKRFEPQDGKYDFSWMDSFANKAKSRGIQLLMCPPMRTAPAWLASRHKDMFIIDYEGRRLEFGSRYTFCINNELLRKKAFILAKKMAEHYARHPAIMGWHLDNEYGDEPDCHCTACIVKWHEWLRKRYKDINSLNEAWGNVFWGLEHDSFDQIPSPSLTKAIHNPAHLLNWRRFRSDCTVQTVAEHAEALRNAGVVQPITTNFQALWNPRTDYYDAAKYLDICGTNYYPPYGDNCLAASFALSALRSYKNKNFHVHELRSGPHSIPCETAATPFPGEIIKLGAHVTANGADGIFFFRWRQCPFGCEQSHGSITGFDGQPTRIYKEVANLGEKLRKINDILEGSEIKSNVAIFYDFQTRWIMETGSRWNGPPDLYLNRCRLLYSALRQCGINVDTVGRNSILQKYKLVVVPFLSAIDNSIAASLVDFVKEGGTIIWHPLSGAKNDEACFFPERLHPLLTELLGVKIADFLPCPEDSGYAFEWAGKKYATGIFLDILHPSTAKITGTYANGWFAGKPAITENSFGKGTAIYLASFPSHDFYEAFFREKLKLLGITPIINTVLPKEVEIAERTTKDNRRLVFLMNNSPIPQEIKWTSKDRDVWNEKDILDTITLPPYGVSVILTS